MKNALKNIAYGESEQINSYHAAKTDACEKQGKTYAPIFDNKVFYPVFIVLYF